MASPNHCLVCNKDFGLGGAYKNIFYDRSTSKTPLKKRLEKVLVDKLHPEVCHSPFLCLECQKKLVRVEDYFHLLEEFQAKYRDTYKQYRGKVTEPVMERAVSVLLRAGLWAPAKLLQTMNSLQPEELSVPKSGCSMPCESSAVIQQQNLQPQRQQPQTYLLAMTDGKLSGGQKDKDASKKVFLVQMNGQASSAGQKQVVEPLILQDSKTFSSPGRNAANYILPEISKMNYSLTLPLALDKEPDALSATHAGDLDKTSLMSSSELPVRALPSTPSSPHPSQTENYKVSESMPDQSKTDSGKKVQSKTGSVEMSKLNYSLALPLASDNENSAVHIGTNAGDLDDTLVSKVAVEGQPSSPSPQSLPLVISLSENVHNTVKKAQKEAGLVKMPQMNYSLTLPGNDALSKTGDLGDFSISKVPTEVAVGEHPSFSLSSPLPLQTEGCDEICDDGSDQSNTDMEKKTQNAADLGTISEMNYSLNLSESLALSGTHAIGLDNTLMSLMSPSSPFLPSVLLASQTKNSDEVSNSAPDKSGTVSVKKSHHCPYCNRTFGSSSNLKQHLRKHTGEKPYKCSLCSASFTYRSGLRSHLKNHEGLSVYICPNCAQTFPTLTQFTSHVCGALECSDCGKKFTHAQLLKRHRQKHSKKLHACTKCGATFKLAGVLRNHLRTHTGERPYKCKICHKNFTQNASLHTHMKTHSLSTPYKCDVCGKAFKYKSSVAVHLNTHFGKKKFTCNVCKKSFRYRNAYITHIAEHSGVKKFRCTQCDASFVHGFHYRKHLLVHSKVKYKCAKCNAEFHRSSQLDAHMVSHDKKALKCGSCGKQFARKRSLAVHEKTCIGAAKVAIPAIIRRRSNHNERQKHNCDICSETFESTLKLRQHINSKHEGNVLCQQCGKDCKTGAVLIRHAKICVSRTESVSERDAMLPQKSASGDGTVPDPLEAASPESVMSGNPSSVQSGRVKNSPEDSVGESLRRMGKVSEQLCTVDDTNDQFISQQKGETMESVKCIKRGKKSLKTTSQLNKHIDISQETNKEDERVTYSNTPTSIMGDQGRKQADATPTKRCKVTSKEYGSAESERKLAFVCPTCKVSFSSFHVFSYHIRMVHSQK